MTDREPAQQPPKAAPTLCARVLGTTGLVFLAMLAVAVVGVGVLIYQTRAQMAGEMAADRAEAAVEQALLARNALEATQDDLPALAAAWAEEMQTRADFAGGEGSAQVFRDESLFGAYDFDLAAMAGPDGTVLFSRAWDDETGAFGEEPAGMQAHYAALARAVLAAGGGKAAGGFVAVGGQAYYLCGQALLQADGETPDAVLILGRAMAGAEGPQAAVAGSGLRISLPVPTTDSNGFTPERLERFNSEGYLVAEGEEGLAVYLPLPAPGGGTGAVMAVGGMRGEGLPAHGAGLWLLLALLAATCAVALAVILWRLNGIVVQPLAALVRRLNAIDLRKADAPLPQQHQTREMEALSTAVNGLLARIGEAQDTIRASNDTLRRLANTDRLTELPNRHRAQQLLQEMMDDAPAGQGVAVFLLDVGRFKHVNDTLGRDAGDRVIEQLAGRLAGAFGGGGLVARYEGDKFLLARCGAFTLAACKQFADEVLAQFAAPIAMGPLQVELDARIGSAVWPEDARDAEELTKNAEMAMYGSKEGGEPRYLAYHEDLRAQLQRRVQMESWMRRAVADDYEGLAAWFQPIVDVKSGRVTSCEALMRWESPEGAIGPMEFIPMSEESGLIVPLTWWMLKSCCAQARHFQQAGLDCRVAVNTTAQVLLHPDFVRNLRAAASEAGVSPAALDVEITEDTLVMDHERVNRVLGALRGLGVQVSVDDFGTGYSSLSYLGRLKVDRIKIDRGFVRGLGASAEDEAIVQAVLAVAGSLGMVVTAEGVETAEQLAFLKRAGCHEVQGFFFSKPLPAGRFIEFAQQWRQDWEQSRRQISPPRARQAMPGLRPPREAEPPDEPAAEADETGEAAEPPAAGEDGTAPAAGAGAPAGGEGPGAGPAGEDAAPPAPPEAGTAAD